MFNFNDFIVENLTKGYANNSFTEEQINIFAMNYLMRGQLTKESFDFIMSEIERIKEEKLNENAVVEPPMIEDETEIEDTDESVTEEENADDHVIEETQEQEESDEESSES